MDPKKIRTPLLVGFVVLGVMALVFYALYRHADNVRSIHLSNTRREGTRAYVDVLSDVINGILRESPSQLRTILDAVKHASAHVIIVVAEVDGPVLCDSDDLCKSPDNAAAIRAAAEDGGGYTDLPNSRIAYVRRVRTGKKDLIIAGVPEISSRVTH